MSRIETSKDLKKSTVFMLTQAPGKNGFPAINTPVPGSCEVFDKVKKMARIAMYVPGQATIWKDEMNLDAIPKKLRDRGQTIYFQSGQKLVRNTETLLMDYLKKAGYNKDNIETKQPQTSVLYYEFNPEEISRVANAKEDIRLEALLFVMKGDINEVRAYALALAPNLNAYREIASYTDQRIRQALRHPAEANPKSFMDGMSEGSLRNKVHIIRAINQEEIFLNENETALSWANGDIFIEAPAGMKAVQFLAEMAIKDQKYAGILEDVKATLSLEVEKSETTKNLTFQESLMAEALEFKVVVKNATGSWYYINKDQEDEVKFKGTAKLIDAITSNSMNVRDLLIEKIGEAKA
jgi:hypothetical protein